MPQEESLTIPSQNTRESWHTLLPFPLELERCVCPICSSKKADTLLPFDQFGFPIGTVECQECGFVYTNPRPTESYMKAFYEKYFWFYFQGRHKTNERFFRRMRTREWAMLRFKRCAPYLAGAKSVLEIGAGSGLFLDQVRKNFPAISVAGMEPDLLMATYCREELGLDVQQGFFQNYCGEGTYDVIVLFHVIEHLFEFKSLFMFVRRHLAHGGLLIMEAPNVDGSWKTIYMIQLSHMHIFSLRTIEDLLTSKGFDVIEGRCLDNDFDESNLFVVGRLRDREEHLIATPDRQESLRIRAKFQLMPTSRSLRVLRAWIRIAYFALRP
jgi:SAM-dependent methyltransferase